MQFTKTAEDRIVETVREWERYPKDRAESQLPTNAPTSLPLLVTAAEDIEHDSFGDVNWTYGDDFDQTLTEQSTRQFEVYNPGLKVWDGARLLVMHCRLPRSGRNRWNIIHAWSATRIRCTAPAGGIAAGGSGTCTSPTDANGYFGFTTLTVYLWTSSVAVQASEELLAELYWDSTATASRWRVYSSDCT